MKKTWFVASLAACAALLLAATAAAGSLRPKTTVAPPSIDPAGGRYDINATVMVTIRAESGAYLVYTLDGSIPVEGKSQRCGSNLVELELPLGDVTIKAIAKKPGLPPSSTRQAVFTRTAEGK